ncbi:MAG: hypothetical protein HQ542_13255, partial [Bacteroidia bacterium]|nr:hypothetical protein [Bacteroidia bacterium]
MKKVTFLTILGILIINTSFGQYRENYSELIDEAVKKGNAHPSHLALLEDRVALGKGEKQIYGS